MGKTIAIMSVRDLLRMKDEVESALKNREPLLFGQYQLVLDALATKIDSEPDRPYASVRRPRAAILLCLQRNGRWMTRAEIRQDLEQGGYSIDNHEAFDNVLGTTLRFHVRQGALARRDQHGKLIAANVDGKRYRNEQYGLAEWVESSKSERLTSH